PPLGAAGPCRRRARGPRLRPPRRARAPAPAAARRFPRQLRLHQLRADRGGPWAPLAQRDPDAQSPAGGVSSSAEDMAKWMTLVLGQDGAAGAPLIASEALMPALTPQS